MKFLSKFKSQIIFIFATTCLIIGFILEKVSGLSFSWELFKENNFYSSTLFVSFFIYLIAIIILYPDVIKDYIEDLKEKEIFTESLLMIISSSTAIILLELKEVLIILLFRLVGEVLEHYASDKARKSITSLLKSTKFNAHLVDNQKIIDIETSQIKIGNILEIRPGENIPVDGIIIKGQSNINLSSLTGESIPKLVSINDKVISGSINIDSVILIKATTSYENSTFSKIIKLVESEEITKSRQKSFMDKFSKIYVPSILIISLLVFIISFATSSFTYSVNGKESIIKAISVLLIGCPCSIIISVPLTTFIGIAKASRLGIIMKNGNSIENLSKINKFAFDKTGTITSGKFKLINKEEISKNNFLIAASLEKKISHPIASAVKENVNEFLSVDDFKNYPGKGVSGIINNKKYFLGSKSLIKENNIECDFDLDNINKIIYLANEKKVIEKFIISDEIKDEAYNLVNNLHELKIKEIMLISGDEKNIVLDYASKVGIEKSFYLALPEEKLKIIKENNPICYVGDGINDSPSLLSASVGISMGQISSDIAIESSDVIICNDSLNKVCETKRLSKYVIMKNYFGIIISLLLKLIILVLVSLNVVNDYALTIASVADTGVMVLAIINALFIYQYKPKYIKTN